MGGGVEAFVVAETQVRGELHVQPAAQLTAQEFGMGVQRLDDLALVACGRRRFDAGAKGLDETGGVFQVRRQADFGHGDRDAQQGLVVDIFLAQDVDQGVTDQLAGAQLALAGSGGAGGIAGVLLVGHRPLLLVRPPGLGPGRISESRAV